MDFSVIVPVYNVAPYLEKCLDSILNQNYQNFEIILIDDGSTDESLLISKQYESQFSNIHVVSQKNQGSGPARNAGMRIAKGDYLFFCDPDDYLAAGFFEYAKKYIAGDSDLIIFSYWDIEQKDNQVLKEILVDINEERLLNRDEFRDIFIELYLRNILYTLWNKLYRRDFLTHHQLKFTDAPMGQDTRFNLDVYPLVSKVQLVRKPFYHYISNRQGSSTRRYRENRAKLQLEEIYLLEKVMEKMNLEDSNLLIERRLDVLFNNSNHIAASTILMKEKSKAIKDLLNIDIIQKVLKEDVSDSSLSMKLLKRGQVDVYLILKSIQRRMLLVKTYSPNVLLNQEKEKP